MGLSAKAAVPELTCIRAGLDVAYKDYKGDQATERPMSAFDLQAEAVRCPDCALVGIASLTEKSSATKIKRLPKGFKVITTDEGDQIYCAACNRPAITLIIDP
jgi:putative heme iron utilization protein